MAPGLVPELDVSGLTASLGFYVDLLGFSVAYERPEEGFAYLVRDGAHLMLEAAAGPGRRFHTAPLDKPFGRGVNLQIAASNVRELSERVRQAGYALRLSLEERWYRKGEIELGVLQFVVADPDGYLLRFSEDLGERPRALRG